MALVYETFSITKLGRNFMHSLREKSGASRRWGHEKMAYYVKFSSTYVDPIPLHFIAILIFLSRFQFYLFISLFLEQVVGLDVP